MKIIIFLAVFANQCAANIQNIAYNKSYNVSNQEVLKHIEETLPVSCKFFTFPRFTESTNEVKKFCKPT